MYIAVDIGGTNIRVAGSQSLHKPKLQKMLKTKVKNNYKKDLEEIVSLIKKIGKDNIEGIGVSIAGRFNKKGILVVSPNLSDWNKKDLGTDLSKIFKCNVKVNNDAYAAALGEAYYGYGKAKNFLFIVWGTGIGGSAVYNMDGKILVDPFEPGHQLTYYNNRKCVCGQTGCWELSCGGAGMEVTYCKKSAKLNKKEWKSVIDCFGRLLTNVLVVRPNDLVIFSGAVATNHPENVKSIHNTVKNNLKIVEPPSKFIISKFKHNAGLYGGFGLLKKDK